MPPKRINQQQKSSSNLRPFPGKGKGKGSTTTLNIPIGVLQKKSTKKEAMVPAPGQLVGKGKTVIIVPVSEVKKMQEKIDSPRVIKAPVSPKLDHTCATIIRSAKWLGKDAIKGIVYMFSTEDQEFADKYIISKSGIPAIDKNRIVVKMTGGSHVLWRKGGLSFQKLLCDNIKNNQLTLKGDMLSLFYGDGKKVKLGLAYASSTPDVFRIANHENNEKMIMAFQSREKQTTYALGKSPISWPWTKPMQERAVLTIKAFNVPYKEWSKKEENVILKEGATCLDYAGSLYKYINSKNTVEDSKKDFSLIFLSSVVSSVNTQMDISLKSVSDVPSHNMEDIILSSSDLIHYKDLYQKITEGSVNIGQFVDIVSSMLIFLSSKNEVTLQTGDDDIQLEKVINTTSNTLEYIYKSGENKGMKYVPKVDDVIVKESDNVISILKNNGINLFRDRILHGVYSYDSLMNTSTRGKIPEIDADCPERKRFTVVFEKHLEYMRLQLLGRISGIINPTTRFFFPLKPTDVVDVKNCVDLWREDRMKVCRSDVIYDKIVVDGKCFTIKEVLKNKTLVSPLVRQDIQYIFRIPPKQKVVYVQPARQTMQRSKAEDEAMNMEFKKLKEKEAKIDAEKMKIARAKYELKKKEMKEAKRQRKISGKEARVPGLQVRQAQIPVSTGMNIMNRQIFNQFAGQMTQNPVFIGFDMERM